MKELLLILLEDAPNGTEGSQWSGMIMILAMIVIFYFFMIRPQSKKQKELKKAREAMKKGDKVITAGGIHGRIKDLKDTYILMEIAPNVAIKIDKTSVFADPNADSKAVAEKPQSKKEDKGENEESEAGMDLEKASGKVSK